MERETSASARAALLAFLRERRRAQSPPLSRTEVARRAGISSQWYARIESGRAPGISEATLAALAEVLGMSGDEIVQLRELLSAVRSRAS